MQIECVEPISSDSLCQAAKRPKNSKLDNRYLSQHLDFEVDNWNGLMQHTIEKFLENTSDAESL